MSVQLALRYSELVEECNMWQLSTHNEIYDVTALTVLLFKEGVGSDVRMLTAVYKCLQVSEDTNMHFSPTWLSFNSREIISKVERIRLYHDMCRIRSKGLRREM